MYGQHSLLHSQQLICDFCSSNWSDPQYDNLKNLSGEALLDIIYEMAPRPSETFGYMMWMGTWVDLDQNIDMIMTDMGRSQEIVQWLRVETCDREIQVRFPAPAVISDLVVVCHSS